MRNVITWFGGCAQAKIPGLLHSGELFVDHCGSSPYQDSNSVQVQERTSVKEKSRRNCGTSLGLMRGAGPVARRDILTSNIDTSHMLSPTWSLLFTVFRTLASSVLTSVYH